jgi:hypothetical protein
MRLATEPRAERSCLAEKRGSFHCVWRLFPVSLAITTALCIPFSAVSALAVEQVRQLAQETVEELKLQTSLPVEENPVGWLLDLPAIEFSSEMFWAALVAMLAFLLYQMRDELPSFSFTRAGRWQENGLDPATGAGYDGEVDPSITGDELARQGRFVEAMHWLLLHSLSEIRERLGVRFPDSLTSREILRRARLPEYAKRLLNDIVTRVELSYFGTYPASEQDYAACRSSFEKLLAELQTFPQPAKPAP